MFGSRTQADRQQHRRVGGGLRPTIEGLERRLLLYSTLGGQWAFGNRITYSFAPDGTSVGGVSNQLYQAMASRGFSEAQWKTEIRRAAAQWQSAANINIVEVTDSGAALGVSGNQQNDSRFGDIRLFATPDSPSVLGYAFAPPPINGGTRAGDIVLNSTSSWNIGANYDLQTVAIHELGHSLGVGHSAYADAAMYATYNGIKQGLTADDIGGIRSLYGIRQHDWVDQFWNNKDPWNAVNISNLIDSNRKATLANLDVTSNQDDDWFYIQAPSNASGEMIVTMQSTNLSSLSPRFQVYNAALQLAGWTVAPNPGTVFGATISLRFTGVPAGTGVFIKAMGWNGPYSGINGIGAYALQVDFSGGPTPTVIVSPPNTTVLEQPDQGGGTISHEAMETFSVSDSSSWIVSAPATDLGLTSRSMARAGGWDDLPTSSPSFGTVAFTSLSRPGLFRVVHPQAHLGAMNLPTWFVQAVDAALETDGSGSITRESKRPDRIDDARPVWLEA
ncbi:matrixin family metalloprotease [Tautonia sociabilis]|nr:matrixin family metalloprotease [Tautonia sociabilis]